MELSLEGAVKVLLVAELKKHATVFDFDSSSLGKATTLAHSIDIGDAS